jgi:peptide chain release factor 3
MRSVPIITFVNKVDREGRPVFETLDEVADALALDVAPMSWPVGMGGIFEGVYDFASETIARPEGDSREFLGKRDPAAGAIPTNSSRKSNWAAKAIRSSTWKPIAMAMTPVYFGSALKNFGVAELIAAIDRYAPPPRPQASDQGTIDPAAPTSLASCSRCRPTWTRSTGTASRSCAWSQARSSAA